ncbi:S26 family signal peptidase [Halolamina sp. C58]|uniref:S26 family signal peptidase n=1 Tax=Halolamina sp. C58 TaxID=3421640 RepID=UPI003EBCC25B
MSAGEGPPPKPSAGDDEPDGLIQQFLHAESGPLMFAREMVTSMATVALVGLLLFAISGVWPPMVAVESGSMNPNMQKGDLIFVTEPGRFAPDAARGDTGVVTHRVGEEVGYKTFNDFGTVVIYERRSGPPVIHRARFWVEDGENWYDEANKAWIEGADNCAEMDNCPAPHAGFITKGDNNAYYDQTRNIREPVKPEWLIGTARLRIPYLGWVRLGFSGAATTGPVDPGVASATTDGSVAVNATASSGVETPGWVEGGSNPGLSSNQIAAA